MEEAHIRAQSSPKSVVRSLASKYKRHELEMYQPNAFNPNESKCKQNLTIQSLHSFRAGGASDMDIEGASPLQIQNFGHWESLQSVYGYIRLGNPDITNYFGSMAEYIKKRRARSGISNEKLNARARQIDKYMAEQIQLVRQVRNR